MGAPGWPATWPGSGCSARPRRPSAPADHWLPDGSLAVSRLSSAGRPSPPVTVAIMGPDGELVRRGATGEIVARGSLVMRDPEATAAAWAYGWHHAGGIGYLEDENYLFIVGRAKDMVITGGFNVYSTEVESRPSCGIRRSRTVR